MAKSFSIKTNGPALSSLLDGLEDDMYAATRVGAQAGAQVLYDQVKQNVAAIGRVTGNLDKSIYQVFDKEESKVVGSRSGRDTYSSATYSVSWRTGGPAGLPRAPHGHLIEYGYLQKYQTYVNKKGEWKTAIRPEMQGKPKPRGKAAKDSYYVLRAVPKQVAARPFIRAAASAFDNAAKAMEDAFVAELQRNGAIK